MPAASARSAGGSHRRRIGRCLRPPRLHHGDLGLHHGDHGRALLRAGRVGSVLFGHGARLLAQRRRSVGGGCGHRSSDQVASCAMSEAVAAARAAGMEVLEFLERRIVSRSAESGRGGFVAPATFTCCPNFSATVHRSPIPTRARSSPASISMPISGRWSGCSWRDCAASPMALPMSSMPFGRTAVDSDLMVIGGGAGAQFAGSADHGGYHRA